MAGRGAPLIILSELLMAFVQSIRGEPNEATAVEPTAGYACMLKEDMTYIIWIYVPL